MLSQRAPSFGPVSLANGVSLLASLTLQVALLLTLGAGRLLEEFLVATAVPTFVTGSLASVAIQLGVPAVRQDTRDAGNRFRQLFMICMTTSVALTGVMVLAADHVVLGLFGETGEPAALMRMLALGVPLYVFAAMGGAVLHAHGRVSVAVLLAGLPAVVMSAGAVAAVWVDTARPLAAAQVLGYGVQALVTHWLVRRLWSRRKARYSVMAIPTGFAIVGGAAHLLMPIFERALGARGPTGTIAALAYAGRVTSIVGLFVAGGPAATYHQSVADAALAGDDGSLSEIIAEATQRVIRLVLSALAVLMSLAPLTAALLKSVGGSPLPHWDLVVVFTFYPLALIGMGLGEIVGRLIYALGGVWLAAIVSWAPVFMFIPLIVLLDRFPVGAIVLLLVAWWCGVPLAMFVAVVGKNPDMRFRLRRVGREVARPAAVTALVVAMVQMWLRWLGSSGRVNTSMLLTGGMVALGGALFIARQLRRPGCVRGKSRPAL